ncbi:MAG: ribonuclease III [Verrucomicrobiota bacterium]
MESLETKIGYKFRNSLLLAEALTHSSLAYETQRPHFDNQRLEFLGDAVLQLCFTDELYRIFPDFAEGRLTKLRSRLVSRGALAAYARSIDLGSYLMLGKGEHSSGGRERPSTLSDAFEALVGAIYLDSGLEDAGDFIFRLCEGTIKEIAAEPHEVNPKGQLQEILQAFSPSSPRYTILSQEGPDHCKTFCARVRWEGAELGHGSGASKKEAETQAAVDALGQSLWTEHPIVIEKIGAETRTAEASAK